MQTWTKFPSGFENNSTFHQIVILMNVLFIGLSISYDIEKYNPAIEAETKFTIYKYT